MRAGRPFRFLTMVVGGWVGLRVLVLWPAGDLPIAAPHVVGRAAAKTVAFRPAYAAPVAAARPESSTAASTYPRPTPRTRATAELGGPTSPGSAVIVPPSEVSEPAATTTRGTDDKPIIIPQIAPNQPGASRWGGSVWAIARPSGPAGGLGSSQLGGSQAGARVTYALGAARRVALVGRVATPLEGRGREAALGVELRVPGAAIRLFAEQRFALDDGARGGPSAGIIAGVDRKLGAGFRLEAYGQAGAIERDGVEGFADGAARLTHGLDDTGGVAVDVGAGAWGGAQRGAERVDVGPTVGVSLPVGGRRIRATLDYRWRVAGLARPGSGPALSLGTDF
ncbi:hypothetical protein [Sphingomonas lenta]|uniref:Uncharacterized protein n=1 Tax=Sphingomonas lenta TaxID=1141887 RepID=A0A2A2SFC0_9SPHN|nr:hypothetical protein [Sphingomonas lenta]PAX07892.1 hypothetical protein CKY28_09790 [Sphingomonas lenta]